MLRMHTLCCSQLAHNLTLSIFEPVANHRATRIVCTIGPSTQSVEALKGLIQSGMSVARMNFSHGSHEYHQTTINNVRQAAAELGVNIAIALDTKGPEIRTGQFVGGEAVMERGATCYVTTDPAFADKGTKDKFYIDYHNLSKVVHPGGYIYIDDGILILHVQSHEDEQTLKCTVTNAHTISDRRGVNLPGCDVDLPAVSPKDCADLQFGVEQGVDMIFASFIRSAEQVGEVRKALGAKGRDIMIICKIENHQGVQNIDSIIEESDGIMVARGDLGVEIPAEKVVVAQKILISKCNVAGKPVICATQMLESMTYNPRPTRAEVSDVANAVFNGADCVMLSGETAKGKYPNEVVQYMARICLEAQSAVNEYVFFNSIKKLQPIPMSAEEAVCSSAVNSVYETKANVMVVLSNTGRSARLVAKYRPNCPIVCVTTRLQTCRQLNITQGVESVFFDAEKLGHDEGKEQRVAMGVGFAKSKGYIRSGVPVVVIYGHGQRSAVFVVPPSKGIDVLAYSFSPCCWIFLRWDTTSVTYFLFLAFSMTTVGLTDLHGASRRGVHKRTPHRMMFTVQEGDITASRVVRGSVHSVLLAHRGGGDGNYFEVSHAQFFFSNLSNGRLLTTQRLTSTSLPFSVIFPCTCLASDS